MSVPVYHYGSTAFEWVFQEEPKFKQHYITVERGKPVLLRGVSVSEQQQRQLIQCRASWITQRLAEVNQPLKEQIVTGSRLLYRGKTWHCVVQPALELSKPLVSFRHSRFFIQSPQGRSIDRDTLKTAKEAFFRSKIKEKLMPRIRYWQRKTGLTALSARVHKFRGRWASCTEDNILEFHPRCMELAPSVMDYVIVHELCHTLEKNHSKTFWQLVERHYPDWQRCHGEIERLGMEV